MFPQKKRKLRGGARCWESMRLKSHQLPKRSGLQRCISEPMPSSDGLVNTSLKETEAQLDESWSRIPLLGEEDSEGDRLTWLDVQNNTAATSAKNGETGSESFSINSELGKKIRHCLESIHVFGSCAAVVDSDEMDALVANLLASERSHHVAESVLFKEGDDGDHMYVVLSGTLVATRQSEGGETVVKTYESSGAFGELALLTNCKRHATVKAITDCELLSLGRSAYHRVLKVVTQRHEREALELLETLVEFRDLSEHEKQRLAEAMYTRSFSSGSVVFDTTSEGGETAPTPSPPSAPLPYWDQQMVPMTDCFCIVAKGEVACIDVIDEAEGKHSKRTIARGECFGEEKLAQQYANLFEFLAHRSFCRRVEVTSESVTCFVLEKHHFRSILEPVKETMKRSFILHALSEVNLLQRLSLSRGEFEFLATQAETQWAAKGSTIAKEGEPGGTMYIIAKGLVRFEQSVTAGESVVVGRLTSGDHFGESTVLPSAVGVETAEHAPIGCMPATAVAVLPTQLFALDLTRVARNLVQRFSRLSPVPDPVVVPFCASAAPKAQSSPRKRQRPSSLVCGESSASAPDQCDTCPAVGADSKVSPRWRTHDHGLVFSIRDLEPLTELGRGSFGTVLLVRHVLTDVVYALKYMKKRSIEQHNRIAHVHNERELLKFLSGHQHRHPFITHLIRTFRDSNAVYLLMEAALGGDLFTLLMKHKRLVPNEVKFISGQLLLALEHLHSRGVLYRDLKPENAVLCSDGYVKLTDFGLAKRIGSGRTYTLCGTPGFLAPEVFRMRGHGFPVDSWALGVLLFELAVGGMPFHGEDISTIAKELDMYAMYHAGFCNDTLPAGAPEHPIFAYTRIHGGPLLLDLVLRLMHPDPVQRLSFLNHQNDIRGHGYFAGLDWGKLEAKKLEPPEKLKSVQVEQTIFASEVINGGMQTPSGKSDVTSYQRKPSSTLWSHHSSSTTSSGESLISNLVRTDTQLHGLSGSVPLIGIPAPEWDGGF